MRVRTRNVNKNKKQNVAGEFVQTEYYTSGRTRRRIIIVRRDGRMPARGCRRDRRTAPPLVGVLIDTRAHARRTRPPRSPRWYYTHGCVIFHTLLYFYVLRGRKKCIFFRLTCTRGRTGKSRANQRVRIKVIIVIFQSTVSSHAAIRVFKRVLHHKIYPFEMSFWGKNHAVLNPDGERH